MTNNYFKSNKFPIFMPDATYGIVNSISFDDLRNTGTKAIVTNTLHLYLNFLTSGFENLSFEAISQISSKSFQKFTGWNGGVITDSGGFQAYSFIKKNLGKIHDDYLEFYSPKNKSKHFLTPEKSIEIQLCLRSNVIIVLDDPIDPDSDPQRIKLSVKRTIEWAKRCKDYFKIRLPQIQSFEPEYSPLIFCVIQGGSDFKMREYCFKALEEIDFDGYGFGGWPMDKNGKFYDELIRFNSELVRKHSKNISIHKFNYAMGVGTPDDIVKCLEWGYDLFDCVLPTRNARHGLLYIDKGRGEIGGENFDYIRINSQRYLNDNRPISPNSKINELRNTSFEYLRYLFKIKDSNALRIATLQNLEFYNSFFENK